MKYAIISLAAITLWTGAASAQDKIWPCIDLHANWQNAPEKQCRQIFIEDRQKIQTSIERPAPTREVVDEIPS